MSTLKETTCDVLIVGGGPAGLSVAAALPDDISCIIVHQDKEIGRPVRTSGGCWLSDAQKLGIPSELYHVADTIELYSDNEKSRLTLQNEKLVIFDVTGLYRWLASKCEKKNRTPLLATKFVSTQKNSSGGYRSTIRSKTAPYDVVHSTYIVDASGGPCAVLRALSLLKKPDRHGVGIEREYPIGKNDPNRAILFVGSNALSGYGWIFPTPDHQLRVGVGVIHPDTDVSPRDLLDQVLNSTDLERMGITLDGKFEVNAGILPSVPYDPKLVYGNVIRVGDSANFATPTVGEGIRICIEFGTVLGVQLGKTISSGSGNHLKHYEKECQRNLSKNYKFGFAANKRMATYKPRDWDKSIRRFNRLDEKTAIALLRSEFNISTIVWEIWKAIRQKLRFSR